MMYSAQIRPVTERGRLAVVVRLVLGVITAAALNVGWLLAVVLALSLLLSRDFRDTGFVLFNSPVDDPPSAVVMLTMVAGLSLATLIAARLWQGRRARTLFGPGARTLRHFAVGAGATFAVVALLSLIPPWELGAARSELPFDRWLWWLPFGIVAIIAQTGAEELFFRGYLQSELASKFRAPLVWLAVPALLFGVAHTMPGIPLQNSLLYIAFASLFGLMAGDLTARTGSIGAGWGFHFANNAVALLFVATPGTITGLALYLSEQSLGEPITVTFRLFFDLAAVLLVWVLIRRLLRV